MVSCPAKHFVTICNVELKQFSRSHYQLRSIFKRLYGTESMLCSKKFHSEMNIPSLLHTTTLTSHKIEADFLMASNELEVSSHEYVVI